MSKVAVSSTGCQSQMSEWAASSGCAPTGREGMETQ
jgi:hypothetical protein